MMLNSQRRVTYPQFLGPFKEVPFFLQPGVIALLWDASGITSFHIPEAEIPADLELNAPKPNTWKLDPETINGIKGLVGKCWVCIPSGKRLHNYGKSPCLMGKSAINGHFQ
jgi:hypothetical protein